MKIEVLVFYRAWFHLKEAQHLSSLAVFSKSVFGMSSMCTRRARNVLFYFLFICCAVI